MFLARNNKLDGRGPHVAPAEAFDSKFDLEIGHRWILEPMLQKCMAIYSETFGQTPSQTDGQTGCQLYEP